MSTSDSRTEVYEAVAEAAFEPTHPGEVLAEAFETLDLPVMRAARLLGVSRQTLHSILSCRQAVTPEMALRIGKLLGNGPTLWLNMQRAWDLHAARRELGTELDRIETLATG
jgi:addiction module HigA family antidote